MSADNNQQPKVKYGAEQYLAEWVPGQFTAYGDNARLYLEQRVSELSPEFKWLGETVLAMDDFWKAPAARNRHHAHAGGLALHTAQVMDIALNMGQSLQPFNRNVVIVGCLWHDLAKIWDYRQKAEGEGYEYTEHHALVGHLGASLGMFMTASSMALIGDQIEGKQSPTLPSEQDLEHIMHIISSHHGRREWGSTVEPVTPEAWAVHAADMMSSQYLKDTPITTD